MGLASSLKKLTSPLKKLTVPAVVTAGLPFLWNYTQNHDVVIDTNHSLIFKKMDGWISHSRLELPYEKGGGLRLYRHDPFGTGYRQYNDHDRDGRLESVQIKMPLLESPGVEGTFNTENNLLTHPDLFEMENRLYQRELCEFSALYQKKYPEKFKLLGLDTILSP